MYKSRQKRNNVYLSVHRWVHEKTDDLFETLPPLKSGHQLGNACAVFFVVGKDLHFVGVGAPVYKNAAYWWMFGFQRNSFAIFKRLSVWARHAASKQMPCWQMGIAVNKSLTLTYSTDTGSSSQHEIRKLKTEHQGGRESSKHASSSLSCVVIYHISKQSMRDIKTRKTYQPVMVLALSTSMSKCDFRVSWRACK